MILIIGGAYQGKLEYAKENYNITDGDIYTCIEGSTSPDLTRKVIRGFHQLVLEQVKDNVDTNEFISRNLNLLKDKIIICDDISCGVVPVDAELRNLREVLGRALACLAGNADEVIRVYCGLGTRLK